MIDSPEVSSVVICIIVTLAASLFVNVLKRLTNGLEASAATTNAATAGVATAIFFNMIQYIHVKQARNYIIYTRETVLKPVPQPPMLLQPVLQSLVLAPVMLLVVQFPTSALARAKIWTYGC